VKGVIFEVDDPDQILAKADAVLTDLIEVSGWPDRGGSSSPTSMTTLNRCDPGSIDAWASF
jgi:hypothetical protein